jgi:hypothetical protein
MRICSVKGCKNNASCENVSFFSFPKTEDREEWIKFTQKKGWTPAKNSTICSDHFSLHLITGNRLQNGAIPTLNSGDQLCQSVEEGKIE